MNMVFKLLFCLTNSERRKLTARQQLENSDQMVWYELLVKKATNAN